MSGRIECPAGCGCKWPDPKGIERGATEADVRDCACGGPCQYDSWDEFMEDVCRPALAAPSTPEPRGTCARYFGSDETLCSTHHGRFRDKADGKCDLSMVRAAPSTEPALDWRGHLNAMRRLLVGAPPSADSIDAAIGYALNDCEAAIDRALDADARLAESQT